MTRVKRGTIAHKKREKVLKATKGFMWRRKTTERAAKEALLHGQARMFKGRKEKKRDFRALWQVQISAAVRAEGMNYSTFIGALTKKQVKLDRKVLSEIARTEPKVFSAIVALAKS